MNGALHTGPRRIEMVEVEKPAVGDEDVVVKIANCGICGSDLHVFAGGFGQPTVIPGHEMSGQIVETGSRAVGVAVGDRVCVEPLIRCGRCRFCLRGDYNLCEESQLIGFRRHGGFAEYIVVPANVCRPIPDNLSFEQAAATEPLVVGLHGIRVCDVGWDDSVVILGGGTIGLLTIAAARAAGARTVIASVIYPHQAALAETFGATHVVASGDSGVNETIMRLLDNKGADVIVETVGGSAPTTQQALELARKGARIVLLGVFSGPQSIPLNSIVLREISLMGSYCYGFRGMQRDYEMALDLVASGRIPAEKVVTHRFKLSQVQQAFETALDKSTNSIKVTLEIGP